MQAEAGEAKAQTSYASPQLPDHLQPVNSKIVTNGPAARVYLLPDLVNEPLRRLLLPFVIGVFLITWACTGAHFMADTNVYAGAILVHQHGLRPDDYHRISANPFWDFGHLLWRPFGWLSFVMSEPFIHLRSEAGQIILSLMGLDGLAALTCVVFFFLLAEKITEDRWAASFATLAFIFSDAFLNYSHTGTAYPVGLACLMVAMYLSLSGDRSKGRACVAGVMFALAALFWLPYIFVFPAALGTPLLLYGRDRARLRSVVITVAACAVVGLTVYAFAGAFAGVRTMADLRAWIQASGHGQIQAGAWRALVRFAFSLPRSFINVGGDGIVLKRYLVHDPYARVNLLQVLRLSLWKPTLFYLSAAAVCVKLFRSERGRILLLILAAAVVPIALFSLVLFEAGSIERYLPLYPFIFLTWAYVFAQSDGKAFAKVLPVLVMAVMGIVNVNAMRSGMLERQKGEALARIRILVPTLAPNSVLLAVNEQDNLAVFCQNFFLDPIISEHNWEYYDVLEINAARLSTWREDLAWRVLWNWSRGGTVWVPLRLFHDRPDTRWKWVEGDDPRIHWSDLPAFFSQFSLGASMGGEDGFVSLPDNSANRQILLGLVRKQTASSLAH